MDKASLLKVSVVITPEAEDAVAELLQELLGQSPSVYADAESGVHVASVFLDQKKSWSSEKHRQLTQGLERIRACALDLGPTEISTEKVRREDWAESWKRHFKPMQIGGKLLLRPSWSRKKLRSGQKLVVLDPGLSFGTGQHPTTRFCLEQLVELRQPNTHQSFLDIGTGSGILAIAAAKLGYSSVEGFDFDPVAVRVAQRNSKRNHVDGRVKLRQADLTTLPQKAKQRFDVICANLTADLLVSEKVRILNRLLPDSALILAGILQQQFENIRCEYENAGLKLISRCSEKEWESGFFRSAGSKRAKKV